MNRRNFLTGAALVGAGAATGLGLGLRDKRHAVRDARYHADDLLGQGDAEAKWYRYKFVGQPIMDTQALFYLGLAPNGLTDIGEVLDTVGRIAPGDEVSWFEQWCETADRVRGLAEEAEARGHLLSAGSHYLRAGAYYRAGLIRYPHHTDPRLAAATRTSLACHDKALRYRNYQSEPIEVPYEGGRLVARVHYSPHADRAPFVLLHQGLHAWPEDTMWVVDGALARGYHVLSLHGPGQGASLRLHGHTFRPDWEVPVGAALDVAETLPRLDMRRAVLMGLSFGGYLAPRAAVHDSRIHALVADPGVLSWADAMLRHFKEIPGLWPLYERGPAAFDQAISGMSALMPDARWYFADVTWKHGVGSPHEVIDELRKYDNRDGAPQIRCKTLILDGVAEDASPGESQRLYDALTCPKTQIVFDDRSGSQTHCQGGGTVLAQARLFDWLAQEVRS